MRFYRTFLILISALFLSCTSSASKPETPLDTLKAYMQAIKKKNPTEMKLLLSQGSLKMAEEEARAQNTTVDEIIKRETLFTETQKTVEFKNEKIEGDRATIEVKNAYGSWDIVPFNREDGEWKIAKERYVEEQMKKTEEEMRRLDEQFRQQSVPGDLSNPTMPPTYPTPAPMMTPPASGVPDMATPFPTP
ncbi:MAG: DUF4878 domain-containing protein [Acidobacteriota bacterium]|nr:DUF4878 domain-containing protein [Acidobacteriota bacterium]